MSYKRIFAATALVCMSSVAAAKVGPWVQTASGQDADDSGASSLHTEYVLQNSVNTIHGNLRTAFVKITYAPGVPTPSGDTITTVIAQAMVGCNDMSWGTISEMSFDSRMQPVLSTIGEFDQSKPVWVLKNMEALSPSALTYRTAKYICAH